MQPQNKRKLMLSVLAVLLIVRFVVVPIFDWQQQQIAQIASQSKKLAKVNRVIDRLPQISQALQNLQQSNQALQSHYYKSASLQAFKLQGQQQIERLFKVHNLQVKNFNWVTDIPGTITQLRARISFSGKTKDLAMLQLALARQTKLLDIGQWTLRIKRMNDHSLGDVTGNFLLTAYYISPAQESAL